jgi:hypothetical protein
MPMLRVAVAAAVIFAGLAATPAGATHDLVYAPCDPEDDRPIAVQVWFIDYQSGTALRYDDPWWGERPGFGRYTNWRHQCRLGQTGVWQAAPIEPLPHPPTHVVETRASVTTTSTTTAAPTTTTSTTTTVPATTTTTTMPATTTVPATTTTTPPSTTLALQSYGLPDGYDLHAAEYDGWPFKKTILLLEQRYPPGTPGKYHFPLSAAVKFLKQGGMVGGLDFLWASGA